MIASSNYDYPGNKMPRHLKMLRASGRLMPVSERGLVTVMYSPFSNRIL